MITHDSERTDAIRYAVLRRLAPGIRHGLMGDLQAIQFQAELALRQLDLPTESSKVPDGLEHLVAQTRVTVANCRSMIEWLRPESTAGIALADGIAQCLKLAGDDWPLRGIEATTELQGADVPVNKTALRELFTAALIALTDMLPGTLDIDIRSSLDAVGVELRIQGRPAARQSSMPPEEQERTVTWHDVEALARVHGVDCTCQGHAASLRLRRMTAESS
jgi:hypothetical protein